MSAELQRLARWTVVVSFITATFGVSIARAQNNQEPVDLPERVEEVFDETTQKVEEVAQQVDQSQKAKEISAGILEPIYALAERLSFPAFHWVAFALMATGVVSFSLQLVLGKLVVLMKSSFSFSEVLSDALGFLVSVIGLVLTTQAAAENSTFTTSPAAVLSASAVGLVAGFIFYRWGQSQELAAVRGRRVSG